MTYENYREPGEFGEGATVRRADPIREQVDQNLRHLQAAVTRHQAVAEMNAGAIDDLSRDLIELQARCDAQEAVLRKIAAYDDAAANAYLRATGSYSAFDEPGAVEMARGVLEGRNDG